MRTKEITGGGEMKEETITSEELAQAHARINKIVHRSDCQNHDNDECFGCKLAECYESIRELISELKFNPQRDGEDKHQVDSIIEDELPCNLRAFGSQAQDQGFAHAPSLPAFQDSFQPC